MRRNGTARARGPGRRRRRAGAAVLGAAALGLAMAGCGEEIVFPENRQPFVYLVLNHTMAPAGEPIQPAFVLTVWRADSVSYLSAERFEMRRASDGALFDWRNESLFSADPSFDLGQAVRPSRANYLLADSATDRGLGFRDLAPGTTYELLVDTGEEVIRSRATIPDTFRVAFPGGRRIAWSRSDGAGGYRLQLTADETFFTRDTSFTVPDGVSPELVRLHALGPHVFAYLTDDDRRRAGLDVGTGVSGGIIEAQPPAR